MKLCYTHNTILIQIVVTFQIASSDKPHNVQLQMNKWQAIN
jgi:hypothetical protein